MLDTTIFMKDTAVAARYDVSRMTVWRWARQGRLPQPVKIAPGTTRWRLADIEAFEASRSAAAAE